MPSAISGTSGRPGIRAPGPALPVDAGPAWTGLQILDTVDGGPEDQSGRSSSAPTSGTGASGVLHERSRFAVRARRWFYVDGDLLD